jgi:hypothetical protein
MVKYESNEIEINWKMTPEDGGEVKPIQKSHKAVCRRRNLNVRQ